MIERALTRLTALTCLNVALVVGILASQIAMVIRLHGINTELSTFNGRITVISETLEH